jgi:hypothetical protein
MIVCCATADVADAKAQIAAADSNMTDKRFMFLAPVEPDEPLPLQTPTYLNCCAAKINAAVR